MYSDRAEEVKRKKVAREKKKIRTALKTSGDL